MHDNYDTLEKSQSLLVEATAQGLQSVVLVE